ncbi:hypothetical protein BJ322DRAFT_382819 [Thelephora terrestris]|uniref:Uncharacterized protein n=1 Tax=Thelephora terrestris TaxID=56493 RepID=A0A9P6HLT8_9AGAM|nr:hypothetical protein BJ322DRAFT_382819 [Thelephora terrestris]
MARSSLSPPALTRRKAWNARSPLVSAFRGAVSLPCIGLLSVELVVGLSHRYPLSQVTSRAVFSRMEPLSLSLIGSGDPDTRISSPINANEVPRSVRALPTLSSLLFGPARKCDRVPRILPPTNPIRRGNKDTSSLSWDFRYIGHEGRNKRDRQYSVTRANGIGDEERIHVKIMNDRGQTEETRTMTTTAYQRTESR